MLRPVPIIQTFLRRMDMSETSIEDIFFDLGYPLATRGDAQVQLLRIILGGNYGPGVPLPP